MISHWRAVKTGRRPDFNVSFFRCSSRCIETRRHDADDPVQVSIHSHALAQNLSIAAESSLPEAITDHNFAHKARRVIIRIETSTDLRLHPQQFEIIWRNNEQPHPRRLFRSCKVIFVEPRWRDLLENSRALKILPFGLGYPDVICAGAGKIGLNGYQLFRLLVRQRFQQCGIDDSENSR